VNSGMTIGRQAKRIDETLKERPAVRLSRIELAGLANGMNWNHYRQVYYLVLSPGKSATSLGKKK
jgi:hypothetical protein